MSRFCKVTTSDGKPAGTVSSYTLGRAMTAPFLASLLVDWLRAHNSQDPLTLGRMVGQALHNAPGRYGSVVRLLLGVIAGLAEYRMAWTDDDNRAAVRLAKRLADAVESGVFPPPKA